MVEVENQRVLMYVIKLILVYNNNRDLSLFVSLIITAISIMVGVTFEKFA